MFFSEFEIVPGGPQGVQWGWTVMSDVTRLLQEIERGGGVSSEDLLPAVYAELRRLAAHRMASEPAGHTLQPTALVHEAWLRLVDTPAQTWSNRAHFFGAAAEAMRRILIERARRKGRIRRGSGAEHVDLEAEGLDIAAPAPDEQLLALSEALDRFAALEPRQAELVKLRYFVGLSIEDASAILGISEATAKRWWAYARAWLFRAVQDGAGSSPASTEPPR
jgi:RNA polymerase sigma factor (TIGR02999 family)